MRKQGLGPLSCPNPRTPGLVDHSCSILQLILQGGLGAQPVGVTEPAPAGAHYKHQGLPF